MHASTPAAKPAAGVREPPILWQRGATSRAAIPGIKAMQTTRRLWLGLGALLVASFSLLLWMGREIYHQAPPVPLQVVTTEGQVVYTADDFTSGRQVWQSIGGMQLGSIWGHGALVAPDWSAAWMHREGLELLELLARHEQGDTF